jgi:hypothetical protein
MSNLGQNNKKSSNTPSRSNNAGINKTAPSPSVITPSPPNTSLNSSTSPLNSNNMYNLKNNGKNTTKSGANNNLYKNDNYNNLYSPNNNNNMKNIAKDINQIEKKLELNSTPLNKALNANTTAAANGTTPGVADKAEGMFQSTANTVSEYTQEISSNDTLMLVIKVILVLVLFIVLIQIVKYYYIKWDLAQTSSPMLIDGTKNAKNAFVISQDPNHTNYVPIQRSVNQDGIEFSYAVWFLINDFSYKQNEWKHMFHKGNSSSYPNRAPGVWIHPNSNMIRVYMNTMKTLLEFVDIDNIPLRKWVHLVITIKNRDLLIYINGYLKIRKELSSLPRQNYGDVWVNMYGGFEGYLAKLQYFDRALTLPEISEIVTNGPGAGNCIDTKEMPPYLDDSWWLS